MCALGHSRPRSVSLPIDRRLLIAEADIRPQLSSYRRLAVCIFGQGKRDIENFYAPNGAISARQRTLPGSATKFSKLDISWPWREGPDLRRIEHRREPAIGERHAATWWKRTAGEGAALS